MQGAWKGEERVGISGPFLYSASRWRAGRIRSSVPLHKAPTELGGSGGPNRPRWLPLTARAAASFAWRGAHAQGRDGLGGSDQVDAILQMLSVWSGERHPYHGAESAIPSRGSSGLHVTEILWLKVPQKEHCQRSRSMSRSRSSSNGTAAAEPGCPTRPCTARCQPVTAPGPEMQSSGGKGEDTDTTA